MAYEPALCHNIARPRRSPSSLPWCALAGLLSIGSSAAGHESAAMRPSELLGLKRADAGGQPDAGPNTPQPYGVGPWRLSDPTIWRSDVNNLPPHWPGASRRNLTRPSPHISDRDSATIHAALAPAGLAASPAPGAPGRGGAHRLSSPTCVLGRIVERLTAKNGLCAPSSSLVATSALGQIQTGARPVSPPPKAPDYEAGIRLARYRRASLRSEGFRQLRSRS
jgi:hypothetical protein